MLPVNVLFIKGTSFNITLCGGKVMWGKKSFFVVSFIVSMLVMSVCSAKTFYSADNRASLVAPDEYVLATPNDGQTIIKIQNNLKQIAITFTVDTEKKDIRTFKEFSAEELEQLKEALKYGSLKRMMESRGYDVSVKKIDANENLYVIGLECTKDNENFTLLQTGFMKDYYLLAISVWAPSEHSYLNEAFDIMDSLTVDGMPYLAWMISGE